jgi:hypothetical protein
MKRSISQQLGGDDNGNSYSAPVLSVVIATTTAATCAAEPRPFAVARYLRCALPILLLCLSFSSVVDYASLPHDRPKDERSKKLKPSPEPQHNETAVAFPLSPCARSILVGNSTAIDRHRRLELLHIPKTAGSTLERQAAAVGITWGACHWLLQSNANADNNCPPHPERSSLHHPELKVSFWHLPLQHLRGYYSPYSDGDGVDLFVVVRNPYGRTVSQWNYMFDMPWPKPAALRNRSKSNATHMNDFLLQVLGNHRRGGGGDSSDSTTTGRHYYDFDGHFVPQIDFVKNNSALVAVLHQETLSSDFACLMDLYGLNVTLPERPEGSGRDGSHSASSSSSFNSSSHSSSSSANVFVHRQGSLTVRDLSSEARQLIADVYRQDFLTFGYKI